jgi:predicted helicase
VPDLHYFRGSYGGKDAIPLWRDAEASVPNIGGGALSAMRVVLGEVKPEDVFAYVYALLSSPSYVARFSEELLYSSPRVPITKNAELFKKVVGRGRALIHLHTYGNRFVPDNQRRGVVPRGSVRCTIAISESEELYPEEMSYDADTHTLTFGTGAFAPVSEEVWNYSLSGYRVIEGWLKNRRRTGSGRKSSPLDDIRPKRWTAEMTTEFLELLWVVEQTIRAFPELEELLNEVVSGACFEKDELPTPTTTERNAPARGAHEQQVLGL